MSEPEPQVPAPLRDFEESLPMALLRAREAVMRQFRPMLHSFGLTEQQWRVLRALDSHEELDATRLSQTTFLLAPSLTRIIRDLAARSLIERRTDAKDGRIVLLSLSPAGRRFLREKGQFSEDIYEDLSNRIGKVKLGRLMKLLRDVEADLQVARDRGA